MCCLFGMMDCGQTLTLKQKNYMIAALATAAEARGTDATGIAYNSENHLSIYKRPKAGHKMGFRIPKNVGSTIMGHTRMTTKGSEKRNYNNHPFRGYTKEQQFALAHNGVIWNDRILRTCLELPKPHIETDSYIAVQLIEQKKALSFDSLKYMAEQLEGSFSFTVMDEQDALYIVKGDNPLCLYYYPGMKLYVYASTEEILQKALKRFRLKGKAQRILMEEGDILQIDQYGQREWEFFQRKECYANKGLYGYSPYSAGAHSSAYLSELKNIAPGFGWSPEDVDAMASDGWSPAEIEEYLYVGGW